MREQGAGDMGIGRKLKAMANAFYGRLAAYDAAERRRRTGGGAGEKSLARRGRDDRARALAAYAATRARAAWPPSLPDGSGFRAACRTI